MENAANSINITATTREWTLQEAFGLASKATITGGVAPTELTPEVNPAYRFRGGILTDLVVFWRSGDRALMLTGPTGCGKSTLIEQFIARINAEVYVVNAHLRTEMADLLGQFVVDASGGMRYQYGPVALAAKNGKTVLVNEYNVLDPAVATGMNDLLQGSGIFIPETGEVLKPAPGFRLIATQNPAHTPGVFQGRNQQDAANVDRFWWLEVGYPTPEEEIPLVSQILAPALANQAMRDEVATNMVEVANQIRTQFMGVSDEPGALEVTMSTRTLLRWAQLTVAFQGAKAKGVSPMHYALERALTNAARPETREAIHEIAAMTTGTANTKPKLQGAA